MGCSSPRARIQRWNKQLMLSFIFTNSSPSRDSSFPSKYSRFTCKESKKKQFMEQQSISPKIGNFYTKSKQRSTEERLKTIQYYLHEKKFFPKPRVAFTGIFCLKGKGVPIKMAAMDTKYDWTYSIIDSAKLVIAWKDGLWGTQFLLQIIKDRSSRDKTFKSPSSSKQNIKLWSEANYKGRIQWSPHS